MKRFALTALLAGLAVLSAPEPPRAAGSSIFWAVGDGADGGSDSREVAAMIASRRVDRFVYLGDIYGSGTAGEFAANYRPVFGRFDAVATPVIGNHEYANRESGFQPYWSAVRGSRMPLRYELRTAGWQLLFLNSNVPADVEQLGWLRGRLSRRQFGSCRIAFMHHPRHSASEHGDDPGQEPLWSALRGRVRMTVAGHDHNMQRLGRLSGATRLISGAGGAPLYPVDASYPIAFADTVRHGALKLVLKPRQAIATFLSASGQRLDRSVTRCKPKKPNGTNEGPRGAVAAHGPRSVGDYPWRARVRSAARFANRRAGSVAFAVLDERRRLHGFHAGRVYPSASVVKVMLMVAYLNRRAVRHRRLHRHDRRLMGPMIRRSDNATASAIYTTVGDGALRRVAHRAGMRRFAPGGPVWGLSRITARDQARFMIRVDRLVPARHRAYALHLLTEVVRRQRWGMPGAVPKGWRLHFKGGFVPEGGDWKTHQVALLRRGRRRMSVAVLTRFSPSLHYGGRTIDGVTKRLFRGYNARPPAGLPQK